MPISNTKDIGALYHALLLFDDPAAGVERVQEILRREYTYETRGNPDAWHAVYELFSIDEARSLRERAALKPVSYSHRVYVLGAWSLTAEAQNALLKLFEEPAQTMRFVLVVPRRDILLPTLRSRCMEWEHMHGNVSAERVQPVSDPGAFARMTPAERLANVAPLIKDKNKTGAFEFLKGLESEYGLSTEISHKRACEDIWRARQKLEDGTVSLKLVLESVALVVPHKN